MNKINFVDHRLTAVEVGVIGLVSASLLVVEHLARRHGIRMARDAQDLVYDWALEAGDEGIAFNQKGDDKKYRLYLKEES